MATRPRSELYEPSGLELPLTETRIAIRRRKAHERSEQMRCSQGLAVYGAISVWHGTLLKAGRGAETCIALLGLAGAMRGS